MEDRKCVWENSKHLGPCRGAPSWYDNTFMRDGSRIYACTHHKREIAKASPLAGYNWKYIDARPEDISGTAMTAFNGVYHMIDNNGRSLCGTYGNDGTLYNDYCGFEPTCKRCIRKWRRAARRKKAFSPANNE